MVPQSHTRMMVKLDKNRLRTQAYVTCMCTNTSHSDSPRMWAVAMAKEDENLEIVREQEWALHYKRHLEIIASSGAMPSAVTKQIFCKSHFTIFTERKIPSAPLKLGHGTVSFPLVHVLHYIFYLYINLQFNNGFRHHLWKCCHTRK